MSVFFEYKPIYFTKHIGQTIGLGVIFLLLPITALAQYSLCGKVVDGDYKMSNVEVVMIENNESVKTNEDGNFCFSGLSSGRYSVYGISEDGFISPTAHVLVNQDVSGLVVDFSENVLDAVELEGEVNRREVRKNHSIKTSVVELSKQSLSSSTVEQMMNRTAGVKIRNSGGLGGNADVVVGGFNGKSIKFLIDGIPVDYLGTSMELTKIPSNVAEYVEIYKGVMPTEVGADALGGAINIVSKKPTKNTHRISYETGSFNTHKLTLNSYYKVSDKLSYGFNTFLNYSDNDFKVDDLPLTDEETGKNKPIRAKLFHNGYKQYSADAYVSFDNRSWADMLKLKVNSYALKKDIQNDFSSRSRPFGEVHNREHAYVVPSIEYKKKVFDDKLDLAQFFVFSSIKNQLADTLKNGRYDWLGNKYETDSGSEMGSVSGFDRPVTETRTNNFTYRGLFSYEFSTKNKLILNVVDNYLRRTQDDPNKKEAKTHVDYNRFIAGLGYQYKLLDNRLEGLTQVKYLSSFTEGTAYGGADLQEQKPSDNKGVSFAQSLKYNFYNDWMIRGSFENTYRLPDQNEIFGDNTFITTNLELKPEQSVNYNLGVRYRNLPEYSFELNAYYRDTKDLIRLKDITQFTSIFLNLEKVKGFGLELEGQYRPFDRLELSGNLTYNEYRYQGSNEDILNNEHFKNARVSNMPFYFGNARATYNFDDLFAKQDQLDLYWNYSYTHQYYLDFIEKQYEPDGFLGLYGQSKVNTNRVIPIQQVHSAGFVWSTAIDERRTISLSAELDNIFNEQIFNAFKMQSPGRSFSAKVTYDF